jgi:hypothetical protein
MTHYETAGIRIVQMDPFTIWILFVVTMIIHATTFCFLQGVADQFRSCISPTLGSSRTFDPNNIDPNQSDHPKVLKSTKATHVMSGTSGFFNNEYYRDMLPPLRVESGSRVQYHALHDTLDVSVFR